MEETKRSKVNFLYIALTAAAGLIICMLSAFFYGNDAAGIAAITIAYGVTLIAALFAFERGCIKNMLLFDNIDHLWRFSVVYVIGLVASALFPLISEYGRPFLVIFVAIVLVSDELTGLCAGASLFLLSELLSNELSCRCIIEYIVPAFIAVMLFSSIDEEFRILIPMVVSLSAQFVCLCLSGVLFTNRSFEIDLFLIPLLNIIICTILILIILKILSFTFVYKKDDKFMEILDPEFELLANLKNYSKDEYDHSIYTAVLCSKLALKMEIEEPVAKALGLYHRIGLLRGENSWENAEGLLKEFDFPEDIVSYLGEYYNKDSGVKSRYAAVLIIAETMISSVSYLFSKDKNTNINFEKLVDTVVDKKRESGVFDNSKLTFEDIGIIKKTLCEEKLFYDFLR